MNVNLEQLQALADLFEDSEGVVELYWDTDNGQRLGRSLERARTAFPRLREELHELTCPAHSVELQPVSASTANVAMGETAPCQPRLVMETECTTCGRVHDEAVNGISTVQLALTHTAATGHVVILNGTTDLPEADDEGTSSVATGG